MATNMVAVSHLSPADGYYKCKTDDCGERAIVGFRLMQTENSPVWESCDDHVAETIKKAREKFWDLH